MSNEPRPKPEHSYTIDRVEVVPGLKVWDYNLRRSEVLREERYNPYDGIVWFRTTTGSFDGQRMWVRHPSTGERA